MRLMAQPSASGRRFAFLGFLAVCLLSHCGEVSFLQTEGWLAHSIERGPAAKSPAPVDLNRDLREQLKLPAGPAAIVLLRDITRELRASPGSVHAVDWDGLFENSRVSFNGVELGGVGSVKEGAPDHHLLTVLPPTLVRPDGPNELRLELSSTGPQLRVRGPLRFGPADQVVRGLQFRTGIAFGLVALYFGVGAYHLLLSARRRSERHYLYFGLFCVAYGVFWTANNECRELVYSNFLVATLADQVSLFVLLPLFLLFVSYLFASRPSRVALAYGALCAALVVAAVLGDAFVRRHCLSVWMYTAVFPLGYVVFFIGREARRGRIEAIYLSAGALVAALGAVHDILVQEGLIGRAFVSSYTFLLFVLGVAAVLADRFARVHNEVEALNRNLEVRVEERTRQVQSTLAEVQELKTAQDGDYYLTSLLLKPLAQNSVTGGPTRVETFLSQKKKFRFRHWDAEIGGDLSSAGRIQLRGRAYTVIINGDAMGKSMQGAGGALVLGTVFKANVTRTQYSAAQQAKHPEFWLRDCFYELQNVFVSFEGSMLTSAVLALVSDDGVLYLINAEHPSTVLYRDGHAVFLDAGFQVRKIGVADAELDLRVLCMRLRPNDVVFTGSDGRDDIRIGKSEDGHRRFNEDERRFLSLVEQARGELPPLVELLFRSGELTDDLSLLRLAYLEDGPPASPVESASPSRREYRVLAQAGRFAEAQALCAEVLERNPERTEFLYYAAFSARRAGNFDDAIAFGERCRLRDRTLLPNLRNLVIVYEQLGRSERLPILRADLEAATAGPI